MLLIPKAAKDLIDKGRAERDARYEEAYRRFGVEVDGIVALPRTPEVQAFLGDDSKESGQRRD